MRLSMGGRGTEQRARRIVLHTTIDLRQPDEGACDRRAPLRCLCALVGRNAPQQWHLAIKRGEERLQLGLHVAERHRTGIAGDHPLRQLILQREEGKPFASVTGRGAQPGGDETLEGGDRARPQDLGHVVRGRCE